MWTSSSASPLTVAHTQPIFFFSSRRRHTILSGDWSSDVCSSDLPVIGNKFDWEWLGYHLTLTCHFPLTGLSFHPSGWLFFHGLISFLSALCPYSPLLAGAETRNSSSNLQDRKSTRLNSSHHSI